MNGITVKENKMGVQPIGKLLASMSIPMMISMLVQAFYNIVDSVFVARISENALTAVSLAFPLQNLMIAVGSGTMVGVNAMLSRSLGAKNQDSVDRAANTGIFLAICSFIVFALIGIFAAEPFFRLQTDIDEIVSHGTMYARTCLGCSFGMFGQFCFERLLQSTGRTKMAMYTQLLGAIINIILDPIMIFGLFGFPKLEVLGAAVATVSGQIVAAVAALILNLKSNPEIHIKISKICGHRRTVREIYHVSIPSIVMMSIGSVMNFGMNRILLSFTTTASAVFGAYFKLQSFIFLPVIGLNNGMVPILAYNFGAKSSERVHHVIKLSIISATCIMLVGVLVMELFPSVLLSVFNASDTMLLIGVPALRIIATHFALAGFCIISGSVFQAIGNPVFSLIVSVCRQLIVLLPAAWLLSLSGNLNLVWLSFPIAEIVSLLMSIIFLKVTMKEVDKKMDGRNQPFALDE